MKEKIKKFIKSKETILILNHEEDKNTLYSWTKLRSPLKFLWNSLIIKLGKYLPNHLKVFSYRTCLNMQIGKNVGIAPETEPDFFYPELITIKDNVIIGMRVIILTHEFTHDKIRLGRVKLEKGCLIGAFTNIRSGITIGENSIVAMNSFVNKNIPPNEIWGGIPAKFIKKNEIKKRRK